MKPPRRPIPARMLDFARQLRKDATDAEGLLWRLLRNRQLDDRKFRRQYPVAGYVLDFYCVEARLAVEVDGGGHNEETQLDHDMLRDERLRNVGIRVLRFWNHDVLRNTEAVLRQIWSALV